MSFNDQVNSGLADPRGNFKTKAADLFKTYLLSPIAALPVPGVELVVSAVVENVMDAAIARDQNKQAEKLTKLFYEAAPAKLPLIFEVVAMEAAKTLQAAIHKLKSDEDVIQLAYVSVRIMIQKSPVSGFRKKSRKPDKEKTREIH